MYIKPFKHRDLADGVFYDVKYINIGIQDDLKSQAFVNFDLMIEEEIEVEVEGKMETRNALRSVAGGQLMIKDEDYQNWDNSNEGLYEIVCNKIGLELVK